MMTLAPSYPGAPPRPSAPMGSPAQPGMQNAQSLLARQQAASMNGQPAPSSQSAMNAQAASAFGQPANSPFSLGAPPPPTSMGAAPDPSAIVSQLRDTTRLFGGGTPGASPQPAPMAGGLGGMQPRPFEGNMPGQPSKTQQNGQIQPGGKSGASPQPYTALGGRTAGRSSGGKSGGAAGPYRQRM